MSIRHMPIPQFRLTLGSVEYVNNLMESAKVVRLENGFDSATLTLLDPSIYPSIVSTGTSVQLDVKDYSDADWGDPILKGMVRFPIIDIQSKKKSLMLSCLGSGYGLGEMMVATEYGEQSVNPDYDTITEIIKINEEDDQGIISQYVNRVFGAGASGDSGFEYGTSLVDTISDVIPFIGFPYKPADKCLNDLVDLVTAVHAGNVGCHWIVTTDDELHLKLISGTQDSWTHYYGGSQANATLTYGQHYDATNFEVLGPEANYVLYYGAWRRPSNGDYWTNNTSGLWDHDEYIEVDDSDVTHKVNDYSLYAYRVSGGGNLWYPVDKDAAWDFSGFTDFNTPTLNFWLLRDGVLGGLEVDLHEDLNEFFYYYPLPVLTNANEWYHFSIPVGLHADLGAQDAGKPRWSQILTPEWNNINYILFGIDFSGGLTTKLYIDGLHFGGANVCRVALNSGISPYKMRLTVDDVGKDDSLIDGDDSGVMAQLAHAELLRLQKSSLVGTVQTPMIKDALPGQLFSLQGTDMRATKMVHTINMVEGYKTTLYLTDDVTNGRARLRYEDLNKQYANMRPEFQDRQSTNIKAGTVDWRIARLTYDYA